MQDYALTIDKFLDHAGKWFGEAEVVGAEDGRAVARYGYAQLRDRANRLSGAFAALGLKAGNRIATLAWNTPQHFEAYYGAMGMGVVCHTLNPRLTPMQLAAMIEEAQDRVIAVSADLLPLAAELAGRCACVEQVVTLEGAGDGSLDALIETHGAAYDWGAFDENLPAGLCYTSGTTGAPKGVLYTHRSNYLHTLRALQADALAITGRDSLLLAVPMFHANGWGLPFAAPAVGTKLVLPGRALDGASLARLMLAEKVTVGVGVQTVWLGLADYLEQSGEILPMLERVVIGGSHCPEALIQRLEGILGARVQTSWGMTELSPVGTLSPPDQPAVPGAAGRPPMGVDLKLTDADGAALPEQRGMQGHLKVRGASVLDRYFKADNDAVDSEGYFDTGDLATIDAAGNLTINGRAKDLIKSGGEWINPAEIEAIVGAHPAVRHVAVVARADVKWGERPVMIVEADAGESAENLRELLRGKIADWMIPRDVVLVPAMPLAATGKIDKARLRADYAAAA